MHHSRDGQSDVIRELNRQFQQQAKEMELGSTGEFPQGQLDTSDEGEIKLAVGVKDGKVILNFGTPVVWMGLDPQQARQLAESLRQASYRAGPSVRG